MYVERTLSGALRNAVRTFPAILVRGPRQSGKTTLLRRQFPDHAYLSLENPDVRQRAIADPVGFLRDHPPPIVLDEIQHTPDLLSYIKTAIDEDRRPGRWLLSGSQDFLLMEQASQSLAGRVALLTLLPMSTAEACGQAGPQVSIEALLDRVLEAKRPVAGKRVALAEWILRGGFPELVTNPEVDRRLWLASYVQTYLERDVRSVIRVRDLGTFQVFLRLAAARTGQLLNLADLARDAGISPPTARQWLNVLEASHLVTLIRPYFVNFGKRLVKSPKLYWLDTGLVTFLVGLHDAEAAMGGPMAGALVETAFVAETVKAYAHRGLPPELWFWRSRDGHEVDLVLERGGTLHPIEIKKTSTPRPGHVAPIIRWRDLVGEQAGAGLLVADVAKPSSLVPGIRTQSWDAFR